MSRSPFISNNADLIRLSLIATIAVGGALVTGCAELAAQTALDSPTSELTEAEPDEGPPPPDKVEVAPVAQDDQIRDRLQRIFDATGWFVGTDVQVRDGVAFLHGKTDEDSYKEWAEELALNTEGVVAAVNQMEVVTPDVWDFSPAREEFDRLIRGVVRALPLAMIALLVLGIAWLLARSVGSATRGLLQHRLKSQLLRDVSARALAILVLLLGVYFVLRIAGLSRLAVTLIGGTGLVGLVLGIAFRNITENFLASLFLSLQNPFREGDLVEIGDTTGFVERLTSRTTILTTLDGNQVQIPNATVFQSVIRNFNSNPNRRDDFVIGIGYDDSIPRAQEIALGVLSDHPAVLDDPEPWVLVDNLGASTVNLKIYFWFDSSLHSNFKLRSSVIRLVKRAFQDAGVSLPDEAREIVFPRGVPVRMLDGEVRDGRSPQPIRKQPAESEAVVTAGEHSLDSEAGEIKEQGRRGWSPHGGENLLASNRDAAD